FVLFFFFFSSRRRHTRSKRDWSSDVCSSDLHNCFTQHTLLCKRFCTFCDALHTRLFLGSDHHVTGPFRDCSLLADQTRYRFLVYSSIRLPKITHRSFPQHRSIRRRRWGAIHVPVARPQPKTAASCSPSACCTASARETNARCARPISSSSSSVSPRAISPPVVTSSSYKIPVEPTSPSYSDPSSSRSTSTMTPWRFCFKT